MDDTAVAADDITLVRARSCDGRLSIQQNSRTSLSPRPVPLRAEREVVAKVVSLRDDGLQYQLVLEVAQEEDSYNTHVSLAGARS